MYAVFIIFTGILYAQENKDYSAKLYSLLSGYLTNDLQLQKYSLQAQSKKLDYKTTEIDNGVSFNLSTGTMTLKTNGSSSQMTVHPDAVLSLPQINGTEISVSADAVINGKDKDNSVEDLSLALSTDIISGTRLSRKASLEQAERDYIEAVRAVQNRAVSAEKEFYEKLKTLYQYEVLVLEAKNDLYDDDVALRKLKAQGYTDSSSTYQKAYLKVQSDIREVKEQQRLLIREASVFAKKCGEDFSIDYSIAGDEGERLAMSFLPEAIPQVNAIDVLSYSKENYAELENAQWDKYIGQLTRQSSYGFTVKGTAGYTFSNTEVFSSGESDTVDASLTFGWSGVTLKTGVSFPTGSNLLSDSATSLSTDPVYTLALSLSPSDIRKERIQKKQDKIDESLELLAIEMALSDYETDVLDKQTTLGDIKWNEQSYYEEYEMYKELEANMAHWLEQGIITESDYLDAKNSRDKAYINCLINGINKIIYNNDTKLLFVNEHNMESI